MAKFKYVKLLLQENNVIKNNNLNDFKIRVQIKFDKKDIRPTNRFKLHILIYSAHKKVISPALGFDCNKSDPIMEPISSIGFSKHIVYPLNPERQLVIFEENLKMVLDPAIFFEGMKIFALLTPEVSYATNEYHFNILFK
jgi:hypothetical protein